MSFVLIRPGDATTPATALASHDAQPHFLATVFNSNAKL